MAVILFFHTTNESTFANIIKLVTKKNKWVDLQTVINNPTENIFTIMFDDGLKINQPILTKCWCIGCPAYVPFIGRISEIENNNIENLIKITDDKTLPVLAKYHLLALNGDTSNFIKLQDIPQEYLLNHTYAHFRLPKNDYSSCTLFDWKQWYPNLTTWYKHSDDITYPNHISNFVREDSSYNVQFMKYNKDIIVAPFNAFDHVIYSQLSIDTVIADSVYKLINNTYYDLKIRRIDLSDGCLENLFKFDGVAWGF